MGIGVGIGICTPVELWPKLFLPVGTQSIVFLAFLRIRKHFRGFVDLFKPLLCLLVARINVRMMLPGQLAKRFLDLVGRGLFRDAQYLVIVFVIHSWLLCGATSPIAAPHSVCVLAVLAAQTLLAL